MSIKAGLNRPLSNRGSFRPKLVAKLTFEKEAGKTRYTARAFHWTAADRDKHIEMGFHSGWNTCLDQLLEVARQL